MEKWKNHKTTEKTKHKTTQADSGCSWDVIVWVEKLPKAGVLKCVLSPSWLPELYCGFRHNGKKTKDLEIGTERATTKHATDCSCPQTSSKLQETKEDLAQTANSPKTNHSIQFFKLVLFYDTVS